MRKVPFLTLEKAQEIAAKVPTPFHIYDEAGIRSTARAMSQAFAWNPGFREYFAVKPRPIPTFCRFSMKKAAAVTAPPIRSCFYRRRRGSQAGK